MPEERQIGRLSSIDSLEARLLGVAHLWLIGERRIGKTSVARAVLDRLRERGFVTLDVDLSKLGTIDFPDLAAEIAARARAAGGGDRVESIGRVRQLARGRRRGARQVGDALKEIGLENEGRALATAAAILGEDEPDLNGSLEALAHDARATERNVFVLIDEVHLLARIPEADAHIARWCREPDSPIVFLFAGSEAAAVEALREPGRPLAAIGNAFELPEIGLEDWLGGLASRFAEAGVEIGVRELEAIVSASKGHPRRTMLIASNVRDLAAMQPQAARIEVVVEIAIQAAQRDRSWH
jgi:hypothetical protein